MSFFRKLGKGKGGGGLFNKSDAAFLGANGIAGDASGAAAEFGAWKAFNKLRGPMNLLDAQGKAAWKPWDAMDDAGKLGTRAFRNLDDVADAGRLRQFGGKIENAWQAPLRNGAWKAGGWKSGAGRLAVKGAGKVFAPLALGGAIMNNGGWQKDGLGGALAGGTIGTAILPGVGTVVGAGLGFGLGMLDKAKLGFGPDPVDDRPTAAFGMQPGVAAQKPLTPEEILGERPSGYQSTIDDDIQAYIDAATAARKRALEQVSGQFGAARTDINGMYSLDETEREKQLLINQLAALETEGSRARDLTAGAYGSAQEAMQASAARYQGRAAESAATTQNIYADAAAQALAAQQGAVAGAGELGAMAGAGQDANSVALENTLRARGAAAAEAARATQSTYAEQAAQTERDLLASGATAQEELNWQLTQNLTNTRLNHGDTVNSRINQERMARAAALSQLRGAELETTLGLQSEDRGAQMDAAKLLLNNNQFNAQQQQSANAAYDQKLLELRMQQNKAGAGNSMFSPKAVSDLVGGAGGTKPIAMPGADGQQYPVDAGTFAGTFSTALQKAMADHDNPLDQKAAVLTVYAMYKPAIDAFNADTGNKTKIPAYSSLGL